MSVSVSLVALARDEALPHRDALLDDVAVRQMFRERAGVSESLEIDRVERRRVKYRFGESLRTVHRVHVGARSWLVSSRMSTVGSDDAAGGTAPSRAVPCDPLKGVWQYPEWQTVCWTFPNDRRQFWATAVRPDHPVLRRAFRNRRVSVSVLAVSPERAVTARVFDTTPAHPMAYLKIYASGTGRASRAILDALHTSIAATGADLVAPRLLDADDTGDVLLTEPVAGLHLSGLHDVQLDAALHALGRATAALHGLPPPHELPRFDGFGAGPRAEAVRQLSLARPEVAARVEAVVAGLSATEPPESDSVWLHGDLNALNWLFDGDDVRLIDFDQARLGPPAADLGGVLAWLRAKTIEGQWTPRRERDLQRAFLRGYASVRPLPGSTTLVWFRSAALIIERALRAVTRYRLRQLAALDAIVEAAADLEAPAGV